MTQESYVVRRDSGRPDAYAVLYRSVFGSTRIGLVAVGQTLTCFAALGLALPALQFALLVLVPGPLIQVYMVLARRRLWPAQEAIMWLNLISADRWREKPGGRMPQTPSQARAWLDRHPEGTAPETARAGMLLLAGRLADARDTTHRLPTDSAHERQRRFYLELALDAKEGRPLDTTAADNAIRADTEIPQVERDLQLAYHAALLAVDRRGDGIAPLVAARAAAGPLPGAYRRRILAARYWGVLAAVAIGAWLLAAVLVGMATSGGVVWF